MRFSSRKCPKLHSNKHNSAITRDKTQQVATIAIINATKTVQSQGNANIEVSLENAFGEASHKGSFTLLRLINRTTQSVHPNKSSHTLSTVFLICVLLWGSGVKGAGRGMALSLPTDMQSCVFPSTTPSGEEAKRQKRGKKGQYSKD